MTRDTCSIPVGVHIIELPTYNNMLRVEQISYFKKKKKNNENIS